MTSEMEANANFDRRRRPAELRAATILGSAVACIVTVLALQAVGYTPCELCLKERLPFYAAVAPAAAALAFARRGPRPAARFCFAALTLLFLASAGLGTYHAGVERGWWAGPSACTGALGVRAATSADFLRQLRTPPTRCDVAAVSVLGVSLAGWNAVVSLALSTVAATGALL